MDSLLRRADKAITSTRETVDEAREVRALLERSRAVLDAGARKRGKELDRIRRRYSRLLALARISCGEIPSGGERGTPAGPR